MARPAQNHLHAPVVSAAGRKIWIVRPILLGVLFLMPSFGLSLFLMASLANDPSDWEYAKLAAPRSDCLIVGTSRAGWGIRPDAFGDCMINFAFSVNASSYGELYHRAILAKVDGEPGGLFLVEVAPLNLLAFEGESEAYPREMDEVLTRTHQYSGRPNPEYLLRYRLPLALRKARRDTVGAWLRTAIIEPRVETNEIVRIRAFKNGRFHVELHGTPEEVNQRGERHFRADEALLRGGRDSEYRLHWLGRTVRDLAAHGRVFMVRLPTSARLFAVEEQVWPDFDEEMQRIADTGGAPYLNLTHLNSDDQTTDFCHLKPEVSIEVSRLLAEMTRGKVPLEETINP